jgi:Spy/CpxP family protein refolding chaperone
MVKTWQVILATIAIFVAGLVTGGATAVGVIRWVARHRGMNPSAFMQGAPRPGQPMQFGPQLMRNFASRLDLTEDQQAKIMPIVRRTAAELARDRREVQLKVALAVEKMQDDISEFLTPEQRSKFDDLVAEQRARLQQFRQGGQPQGARPVAPDAPK